jgi:four helix bundle protein
MTALGSPRSARCPPKPLSATTKARAGGVAAHWPFLYLRVLDDIVHTVGTVHQLCRTFARHDPDLSRQIKRAVNSVGLNAGEGLCARGGNRTVRLETAMASGREVIMGLRIAGAAGTLTPTWSRASPEPRRRGGANTSPRSGDPTPPRGPCSSCTIAEPATGQQLRSDVVV